MSKSTVRTEEDLIAAGFHRLDNHLVTKRPPKIKWGEVYKTWADSQKIAYLEKLSSSMNHAAHLIQGERDELNDLCEKKEDQLRSMKDALDQNNGMIQDQITRMSEEKQELLTAIAQRNTRIRELESGYQR
jgi:chromosome segregation ATPase